MHTNRTTSSSYLLRVIITALCATLVCAALGACASEPIQQSRASSESFGDLSDEIASSEAVEQPAEEPAPEPEPEPAAIHYADALAGQLESIAANSPMNVGIAFVNLEDPSDACYVQADRSQRSASMIKLLILNELFNQVNQGTVSLDEPYTLTGADIVGGTGTLQGRGAGAATTFREMAQLMISASDNTATNVIIDRLGMANINARANALGLGGTSLQRKMMDTAALSAGIDNYMSARDAATLLQQAYTGTFVDPSASQFAMEALQNQSDSAGILAGLSGEVAFAHKTGTLSNAQNDAGIVLGGHPYVLSVFCETGDGMGSFSQGEAYEVMRQCGAATSSIIG